MRNDGQKLIFRPRSGLGTLVSRSQLFFGALTLSDVNDDGHGFNDFALSVSNRRHVAGDPDLRPVFALIALLEKEALADFKQAAIECGILRPVVGVCNVADSHIQQFVPGTASNIAIAAIDHCELAGSVGFSDSRYHLFRQSPPGSRFTLMERCHRPPLLDS